MENEEPADSQAPGRPTNPFFSTSGFRLQTDSEGEVGQHAEEDEGQDSVQHAEETRDKSPRQRMEGTSEEDGGQHTEEAASLEACSEKEVGQVAEEAYGTRSTISDDKEKETPPSSGKQQDCLDKRSPLKQSRPLPLELGEIACTSLRLHPVSPSNDVACKSPDLSGSASGGEDELPDEPDSFEQRLLKAQNGLEARLVQHLEGIEAAVAQLTQELQRSGRLKKRPFCSDKEDPGAPGRISLPARLSLDDCGSPRRLPSRQNDLSMNSGPSRGPSRGNSRRSSTVEKVDSVMSAACFPGALSVSRVSTNAGQGMTVEPGSRMVSRTSSDASCLGGCSSLLCGSSEYQNSSNVMGAAAQLRRGSVPLAIPEHQSERIDMMSDINFDDQEDNPEESVIKCRSFTNIFGMQLKHSSRIPSKLLNTYSDDREPPTPTSRSPRDMRKNASSCASFPGGANPEASQATSPAGAAATTSVASESLDSRSLGSDQPLSEPRTSQGLRSSTVTSLGNSMMKTVKYKIECPKVHPNSSARTTFDFCSLLVLLYDSTMIPYQLAWETEATGWFVISSWMMVLFWTFDMILSFSTGYYSYGELEMRRSAICRRYLRTWFIFDFGVNLSDFLGLLLSAMDSSNSNTDTMKVLRMVKVNRVLRIMAFLRIVRIYKRMDGLRNRVLPESVYLLSQIVKVLLVVLWLNHILACTWYGIARHGVTDTGDSWLVALKEQSGKDTSIFYEYTTAYHWSMSQMTPGSMEVVPTNSAERAFNVMCLFLGLLMSISLISQLSAKMVQHNMSQLEMTKNKSVLRRFLLENSIRADLAVRIQQQIKERMSSQKRLAARDVSAIKLLSPNVRSELMTNAWSPHLLHHQLFYTWDQLDSGFIKNLCVNGVELLCLAPDDELFVAQSSGEHVYESLAGDLLYIQEEDDFKQIRIPVEVKTWISEASLWMTEWVHRGTMRAQVSSEVISININGFLSALRRHRTVTKLARDFSKALNTLLEMHGATSVTDLTLGVDYAEILLSMPVNSRELMTKHIIDDMKQNQSWTGWVFGSVDIDAIEQECSEGLCTVVLEPGPVRVLLQVTLKVLRSDGRFLVQVENDVIARHDYPSWGTVRLPCTRREDQEHPREALDRLLDVELGFLAEKIELVDVENSVDWKDPLANGMKTKYIRVNYHARLSEEDESVSADQHLSMPGRQRHSVNSNGSILSTLSARDEFGAGCEPTDSMDIHGNVVTFLWFDTDSFDHRHTNMGTVGESMWIKTASIRMPRFNQRPSLHSNQSASHSRWKGLSGWLPFKRMLGASKTRPESDE